MFSVYILFSEEHDKYYVGQTDDLERRLLQHNELSENSFTSRYRPWVLALAIAVPDRTVAIKMERFIKKQNQFSFANLCATHLLAITTESLDRLLVAR